MPSLFDAPDAWSLAVTATAAVGIAWAGFGLARRRRPARLLAGPALLGLAVGLAGTVLTIVIAALQMADAPNVLVRDLRLTTIAMGLAPLRLALVLAVPQILVNAIAQWRADE